MFAIGVRTPGTGVTDSCELSCGCWELNPGPLEEQLVLLTAERTLQALKNDILRCLSLVQMFWLLEELVS